MQLVIVGASAAGLRAARAAREAGFEGRLVVVGAEADVPYQRPPLSKDFLSGGLAEGELALEPPDFFLQHRVELELGQRATALDVAGRALRLESGRTLRYDALVLATGATARRLDVPGALLDGVVALRTLAEAREVRERLAAARRVVVVGAGLLGLEVAAAARGLGKDVAVVDRGPAPMGRVLPRAFVDVVARLHRAHGVALHLGTSVEEVRGQGRVQEVVLHDGTRLAADVVVTALGVQPALGWLRASPLGLDDGIRVDAYAHTGVPGVWAAGDVACGWHPHLQRFVRLESWGAAAAQGATAGKAVAGVREAHAPVPGAGTTHFGQRVQVAGDFTLAQDVVLRGDAAGPSFAAFGLRDGRLVAVFGLNRAREVTAARAHLARPDAQPLSAEALREEGVDLRSL